ncbi:MAG: DEAD/DEAH box helicase [Alphaproteobacteria bacterium]|nr:DEAD/DEAH box helicase [Alphaproteobacteria bacterium]
MNFKNLGLSDQTVRAIEEQGILTPTTVQADVIPSVLEGKDIFTIAPSRSGKTYSYVMPLIDIIEQNQNKNILIITADSYQAANVSDSFAVFGKYHKQKDDVNASSVIIATPDLILDLAIDEKVELSKINILVVDDINLIKKKHQLSNLEKILEKLPSDKQNIVFTNRRSKETQLILDKILKTPTEIKVDKNKEDEVESFEAQKKEAPVCNKADALDDEAVELSKKYRVFGDKTPRFLLIKGELAPKEAE